MAIMLSQIRWILPVLLPSPGVYWTIVASARLVAVRTFLGFARSAAHAPSAFRAEYLRIPLCSLCQKLRTSVWEPLVRNFFRVYLKTENVTGSEEFSR